jgi:hypothetical protein
MITIKSFKEFSKEGKKLQLKINEKDNSYRKILEKLLSKKRNQAIRELKNYYKNLKLLEISFKWELIR